MRLVNYIAPAYRLPLVLAVGIHLALILLLILMPQHQQTSLLASQPMPVIQAHSVDSHAVAQELAQLQQQKVARQHADQQHIQASHEQAMAAKRARLRAQQQLAKLRHEQALQKKRLHVLKQRQHAAALKLKHQQQLAAQQARAIKQARDKKIHELAAKQHALAEKLMQQQLAEDQTSVSNVQSKQLAGVVNKYSQAIKQTVRVHWLKPENLAHNDISTEFLLTLAPDGSVIKIQVLRSSGNGVFDQSAKTAVLRSSPLPVPKNSAAFNQFRQFHFTFFANPKHQGVS